MSSKVAKQHKLFDTIAQFSRRSAGWFFGLKLHLVINHQGELMAFKVTLSNRNDSKVAKSLVITLRSLAFGDKDYICKKLFDKLFSKDLKLITRKHKIMKHIYPLITNEKQLLNQHNLIETIIEHVKHHYQVWHTRHHSIINAMTHLIAALAAYVLNPLKLSAIKILVQNSYLTLHKRITY